MLVTMKTSMMLNGILNVWKISNSQVNMNGIPVMEPVQTTA